VNPEYSQSGTNTDTVEYRANGNRRDKLRKAVTTSGISISRFNILSTPENQQKSRLVQSGPGALQIEKTVLLACGGQRKNSNLAANANANNINTANVTASPRSSNAPSPDDP